MSNFKNPFKSGRVRDLPPEPEPTPFEIAGGWGPPTEAAAGRRLDPEESERAQRVSGALALADLAARDADHKRTVMDARLAGARRGRDYSNDVWAIS